MVQALPCSDCPEGKGLRLGILTAGDPAPGMNTAVRTAVRLGLDQGVEMIGIRDGFQGLVEKRWMAMDWMSVRGWGSLGGSELGISPKPPEDSELEALQLGIRESGIQGLLLIGGWTAWETALKLEGLDPGIPIVCLPACIDNNLPGSELALGADTALNSIVENLDKIKRSAVASRRCFVVEVMGEYCGYLALLSGIASGAEGIYLHEEGVSLDGLRQDVQELIAGFERGKRLGLLIRAEKANECYTTQFMMQLFEEEGGDLFDVRQSILGHLQQGGDPSPFDRIHASRLAAFCLEKLMGEIAEHRSGVFGTGLVNGQIHSSPLKDLFEEADLKYRRPKTQWWEHLIRTAEQLV